MKFKGRNWRRSHVIVNLPATGVYLCFGRLCKPTAKGAIKTTHRWQSNYPKLDGVKGQHVYAKPLPISGWSLTNMAYGKPTFRNACGGAFKIYRMPMYLMFDGYCYTSSYEISKQCYEANKVDAVIPDQIITEEA